MPVDLIGPQGTNPGERIDITFLDETGDELPAARVEQDQSFLNHVPRLADVIDAGTPQVREMAGRRGNRNNLLVRNTVTINRGRVGVRELVPWDEGGFPLNGQQGQRGLVPASPAHLKFVGSDLHGYLASEIVVDVDANAARVDSDRNKRLHQNRNRVARGNLNHRTPYETVEILISNYEFQENTPLPWGLDFQWLFEAAGYPAVDLDGDNLTEFARLGTAFNPGVYRREREMLLDQVTAGGTIVPDPGLLDTHRGGRPFPYVVELLRVPPLRKERFDLAANEEEFRPICIGGFEDGGP